MSKKKNPNGSRVERENKFADALGLGTGRTFMGACLSAFESGAGVSITFTVPDKAPVRYSTLPPLPVPPAAAKGGASSSICPGCGHMDGYHPPNCMVEVDE